MVQMGTTKRKNSNEIGKPIETEFSGNSKLNEFVKNHFYSISDKNLSTTTVTTLNRLIDKVETEKAKLKTELNKSVTKFGSIGLASLGFDAIAQIAGGHISSPLSLSVLATEISIAASIVLVTISISGIIINEVKGYQKKRSFDNIIKKIKEEISLKNKE